jgi:dimethylamine monooxygenase subunit A
VHGTGGLTSLPVVTQPEPRAAPPAWTGEIEPVAGPPFLRMGTHASGDAWLTTTPGDAALLTEKRAVLAEHHEEAVAALPGTEPAAAAALAAVVAWRELREPAEPPAAAPRPDTAFVTPSAGPLDTAGRLVAEDLCLLVPGTTVGVAGAEGGWVLGAGSVCFPSHWRLRDKLGLPTAAIHGPVPHYADELAARVDRFLARLAPGRSVWRRNWTVHTSPELFVPEPAPPPDPPVTAEDAGERLWLRSERQALVRLARHRAVLFTIRTDQVRLGALRADPPLCARMADAVASWSPGLLAYRGGEAVRRPLLGWLRAAALGSLPQA